MATGRKWARPDRLCLTGWPKEAIIAKFGLAADGDLRGAPFGNRPGSSRHQAKVAELVDALDLGSSAARLESSSLSFRTKAPQAAAMSGYDGLVLCAHAGIDIGQRWV